MAHDESSSWSITTRPIVIACLVTAAACCGGTLGGPEASSSSGAPTHPPTIEELATATYEGILERPVTLSDGRWEGQPFVEGGASRPTVGLVDHFILAGDLDGDGRDEAATLLWESSGGSGSRLYLAAIGRRDGGVENIGTDLIGDRVQVRSGAIDERQIILDIVRAGPADAACCPTEKALVTWVLDESGLNRFADETTGTLSLTDIEGPEWVLCELGRGQTPPEDVEISLEFRDARVSGRSGCNDYFAAVVASAPGELRFNAMGATRMACPEPKMEVERRYLKVLAAASGYSFRGGRLVLVSGDFGSGDRAY